MAYQSINPATQEQFKSYQDLSDDAMKSKLKKGHQAFQTWSGKGLTERVELITSLGKHLLSEKEKHARMISLEMGKPIKQATAEIEKCALLCDYYAENAPAFLKDKPMASSAEKSFLSYEPIGIIYAVMPWNFPYWQVFRFLVPNLILGNTGLLKHASNVPQCAEQIELICQRAGIPEGVFQNLFISYQQSEMVLESPYVQGATLTGSEYAGSKVARSAGKNIKKSVLELGGSDPFIVLNDADLDGAVQTGITARMQNAGQSCIAAKRFIVQEGVYEEYLEKYVQGIRQLKLGDPLDESTDMGPIARPYLVEELEQQIDASVQNGARLILGGKRKGAGSNFFEPGVLTEINQDMPVYFEEVFGPVALFFKVKDEKEAIELANETEFGLGAALWTSDQEKARSLAKKIMTGTVAVNGMVKSEPGLPFGGVKKSGYGRELSELGLKEFANIKTINIF